jgi:Tol biopolymer transport system component
MTSGKLRAATVLGTALSLLALTVAATAVPVSARGGHQAGRQETGGQIVFRRYFDADQTQGALFVVDPDGSHARQVTHPPSGWKDNVPAWSPRGKRITFERFKSDESTSRIMVVNPDTGATRVVVPCAPARCAYAVDPYFSPDGRSIAYSRTVKPPHSVHPPELRLYTAIFVVRADGSRSRQVTSTPERHRGHPPAFEDTDPTFSPSGKRLAFIRKRFSPEENSAVFVQPIGSPGQARRITPWGMDCQDRPTFSPGGRLLLFRCVPQGEDGPSNLYVVHPSGAGLHRITRPSPDRQYLGSSFAPTFRHGHGWITAGRTGGVGDEGNADVFRLLVSGGHVVRSVNLTRSAEWDSGANWGTHPPVG